MIIDEASYSFLEHHGVKGMRWGVRRTPSQLSSNKSSSKKSGKVGFTNQQAAIAVYGGTIAAIVLAQQGMKYADSGRRDARKSKKLPFKENPNLAGKKSIAQINKDIVPQINPGYGDPGTKMNCRRVTMAYEMRRRGYDVKATKSNYATGQTVKNMRKMNMIDKADKFQSVWGEKRVSTPTEYARMTPQKKAETVFSALSKHPNGARGEIGIGWIMGGGHSQAWEIIDNKPVIFDSQNGKTYSKPAHYAPFASSTREMAHTRLDNRQINEKLVKRWVTNV